MKSQPLNPPFTWITISLSQLYKNLYLRNTSISVISPQPASGGSSQVRKRGSTYL